jgi:hypothetical protein
VLEAHYIIATLPDQYGSDEILGQYGVSRTPAHMSPEPAAMTAPDTDERAKVRGRRAGEDASDENRPSPPTNLEVTSQLPGFLHPLEAGASLTHKREAPPGDRTHLESLLLHSPVPEPFQNAGYRKSAIGQNSTKLPTKFATKIAGKGLENENERQVVELAPSKP